MKFTRATYVVAACASLAIVGWVIAQDQDGFESLLQEISQPAPTQQAAEVKAEVPPAEAQPEAAVTEAPAAEEPAMEAPTSEAAAVSEEPAAPVEESAVAAEPTQHEAEVQAEAPAVEAQPVASEPAVEAPVETEPLTPEPAPDAAAPAADEFFTEEPAPSEDMPAPVVEEEEPAAAPAATATESTEPAAQHESVEQAAADEGPGDITKDVEQLAKDEEIRRQARESQARKTLDAGFKEVEGKEYDKAISKLEVALGELPDRPANKQLRDEARRNLADAYYRKAAGLLSSDGNLAEAKLAAENAKKYGRADAADLLKKIAREDERQADLAKRRKPVKTRAEFVEREKTINDLMIEGKDNYKNGDLNAAESAFERVLLKDEYNVDAMRMLRKIGEVRYSIRSKERAATEADMLQKVRDAWNPPIREEVGLPGLSVGPTAVEKKTAAQKLQDKMDKITFPLIDFRAANIVDVVKFLNDESANLDPENIGVNIILKLSSGGAAAPAPMVQPQAGGTDDLFGGTPASQDPFASQPHAESVTADSSTPSITLSLRRVTLLNAIKYITEVAGLKYRIDEDAVIITPVGTLEGRVVTRLYPVQPTFLDVVVDKGDQSSQQQSDRGEFIQMGANSSTIKRADVKEFFERAGVPFPAGTSITFNPGISQLIVANTPENLEVFERILAQLNVIPNQVEIEARFVEIGQDDLEELGLQWILTDNYEIASKGNGPVTSRERIQVNRDTQGFSKGLRFFEVGQSGSIVANSAAQNLNPIGDIATVASVLTNPELKVIIQALSQHGGSDLLSAPRVTTRSGVNATIQVVREIIYPTEFETTQPQFSSNSGDTQIVTPPLVTPGTFETRETGVILNVTPTVGPDGYTIDLTMVPEVTELVDWINYGSTFGEFTFNIPQPVFATRKVTTSIVIWDGQTVVMGGLIREDLIRVKDKIPFLGDLPLIGRLFRSEGEYSKKKNLLIFVTARLVDPAGKTIHKAGEVGVTEERPATAAAGAAPAP